MSKTIGIRWFSWRSWDSLVDILRRETGWKGDHFTVKEWPKAPWLPWRKVCVTVYWDTSLSHLLPWVC